MLTRYREELQKIKLLALDLDGTVLTDRKEITERTRRAIRAAAEAGILPVYVTGRPLSGLPEAALSIPGIRFAITSNGAVTTDLATGTTLRSAMIPAEQAREILEIPIRRGLVYCVFVDGMGYSDTWSYDRTMNRFRGTPIEAYVRETRYVVKDVKNLFDKGSGTGSVPEYSGIAAAGVENIWIMAEGTAGRDEVARLVRARTSLQIVTTADTDVEIGSPDADKGLALTALADAYGIRREQVLAIGDNDNDLGMLRAAGISVAMGNAADGIRRMASFVTASNEEDGVADVIEAILEARLQT